MQRVFPYRRALSQVLAEARSRLCAELEDPQIDTVEARQFRTVDSPAPDTGSKPLFILKDESSKRYVLKVADRNLCAAEELAYRLRRPARRPTVPARWVRVDVEGTGVVEGLIKPFVHFDSEKVLSTDSWQWSELQRTVILREHAWEWFLDNMDTNSGQFALLGPHSYPVNLDWDRAFSSAGHPELSRFAKYKHTLPNARTFLYADYVQGRVSLRFDHLLDEARSIENLSEEIVARCFRVFVESCGHDCDREIIDQALDRRRNLTRAFQSFIVDLQKERRDVFGDAPRARHLAKSVWKLWQVALMKTFQGPIGKGGRKLLKLARSAGHRLPGRA